MKSQGSRSPGSRAEPWIALAFCVAVLAARALEHFFRNRTAYAPTSGPDWLPLAATGLAAAGIMRLNGRPHWLRSQRALFWGGLLLMVWEANGLPLDLFCIAGLIPLPVDWTGMATRTFALAAAVVLAHPALARPASSASPAAQLPGTGTPQSCFALPYPVLRTHCVLGGRLGLSWPGSALPRMSSTA